MKTTSNPMARAAHGWRIVLSINALFFGAVTADNSFGQAPAEAEPSATSSPVPAPVSGKPASAKPSEAEDSANGALQEVVVTGTFLPVSKLQATTAISTIDASEIQLLVPTSAMDLLSNVPGVWVDTSQGTIAQPPPSGSGGYGGTSTGSQVVQSRGIGFVSVEEDGLPVEGAQAINALAFGSLLFADATLDQIQVVRGGSAAITGSNAPGGIFNYISKTGGDSLSAQVATSFGEQGNGHLPYERVDANVGGPLPFADLFFNIGGFYQHDHGARDAGYPLDYGGQLKGNLLKKFDRGSLELYVKYLDNHNAYGSLIPAVNWNSPTAAPGWNNTSSVFYAPMAYQFQTGPDSYQGYNSGDLVYTHSWAVGVKYETDLGAGWSLHNNAKFSHNQQVQYASDCCINEEPLNDSVSPTVMGTLGMAGIYTYRDPLTGASARVQSLNGTDFTVLSNNLPGTRGLPNSVLFQAAQINNLDGREWQDQLSLTKRFDRMSFTLGAYYDHADVLSESWDQYGVSTYTPRPQMLDVTLTTPSGRTLQITNPAGFAATYSPFDYYTSDVWKQLDLFFGHTWEFADQWSLDWGIRYEVVSVQADNTSGNSYSVTTSTSDNLYADSYSEFGPLYHVSRSIDTLAYSAALNREIDAHNSVYVRYSLGKKSPDLPFYTSLSSPAVSASTPTIAEDVVQWEIGYKLEKPRYSLEVTPYFSLQKLPQVDSLDVKEGNGQEGLRAVYTPPDETRNIGIELDGKFHFDYGFSLRTAFTWQKSTELSFYTWTQPNGPGPASNPTANAVLTDLNVGNRAENVPNFMAMITPQYANGRFLAQVQWQYMGSREANNYDAFVLPAYNQTNLTLQWAFNQNLNLSFTANNVFDSKGVVEWAPPGDVFSSYAPGYTRAQVLANPNAVFYILQTQARAYFLKLTFSL